MQTLLLGTAQWGSDYGITNAGGRLADSALTDLLEAAEKFGLTPLDTAPAYGDAEARIGLMAPSFLVQTKVNVVNGSEAVRDQVLASCELLDRPAVWGLLAHDWPSAGAEARAMGADSLAEVLQEGLAARVGVSAYEEVDFTDLLTMFPTAGLVQVPVNLLDQRLVGCRTVTELRAAGVRIQARSVFLQGLLVAEAHSGARASHPDVERVRRAAAGLGLSPLSLALGFIRSQVWIDEVVVAPTSAAELLAIYYAWSESPFDIDWSAFASGDLDLIDPRRWV